MWYVGILNQETDELVEEIPCKGGERSAKRLRDGVEMNLNHDLYYTEIYQYGE